jgi:glycosyltransferase involved in cell wall biosynthesis
MLRAGVPPDRIWTFANTVDTEAFAARSDARRAEREELRRRLGVGRDDVVALSVCRLVPEKGLDVLLRAAATVPQVVPVLAGAGPERARLEALAVELGSRAVLLGDVPWEEVVDLYVAADLFVLLSRHEPWGVVVNEAAACALPLVLSEHVGAAPDLVEEGENGFVVAVDDVAAAAAALRGLAADAARRERFGRRSREIALGWGYDASVDGFVAAVGRAATDRG